MHRCRQWTLRRLTLPSFQTLWRPFSSLSLLHLPPSLHPPFALKTGGARVHETARPCRIIDTRPYSTDKIDFLFNFASNCREFEASCVDEDGKEKKEKEKKTRSLRYMTNCFIFNVEDTVDKFIPATEYRRVTRKLRTHDPLFYHSCLFYRAID